MKTNRTGIVCGLAFVALFCFASCAQEKGERKDYNHFSKWGLSFDYPKGWQEHPADRVAMMKDALGEQLRPYGRAIQAFAMITGPNEETALLASKYTIPKEMRPSEFVAERNQVYDDAKRAGDVTKVNFVKETKIAGLPGVEEDVERSNGGRGRTLKMINGTTVFELSFVVNNATRFAKYSDVLDHLVSSVALAGVAAVPKANQEQQKDTGPSFGQSFNAGSGKMKKDEAVEKVSAGMTLEQVESLLGKGTQYAEVENAKQKYGFWPDTPEGQRNTYLWFRPNDRVYVAVFTEGKLSFSFTKLPPGK